MHKRLLLISCFLIGLSFIRCTCTESSTYVVDWQRIEFKPVKYYETSPGEYYSYETTSDTVFHGPVYGFNLMLRSNVGLSETTNTRADFANAAYALKCQEDYFVLRKKATSFKIETLNDFDEEHRSNSDITDYFTETFMTENYLVDALNQTYPGGYSESRFVIRLHEIPTLDSIHQFKVTITLEDSTSLSSVTERVKLLPK